jgi:hypothetical protein
VGLTEASPRMHPPCCNFSKAKRSKTLQRREERRRRLARLTINNRVEGFVLRGVERWRVNRINRDKRRLGLKRLSWAGI